MRKYIQKSYLLVHAALQNSGKLFLSVLNLMEICLLGRESASLQDYFNKLLKGGFI